MRRLTAPFVLLGLAAASQAQVVDHWVVPAAFAGTDAASTNDFPFTYTNYVRLQQCIDASVMGAPRIIEGISLRPRRWPTGTLTPFTVNLEVRISLSANAPASLDGTYANNIKGTQTVAYSGPVYFHTPTGNSPHEFSVTIPFRAPFIYIGTDPLLLDFIPLDACAGGGNGKGCDFDRTTPGINTVGGKNPAGCGTPTTGGFMMGGGYVIQFHGAALMPYGFGCAGTSGTPQIGNTGAPTIGNAAFAMTLSQGRPSSAAALFIGRSRDNWATFSLPLDLTQFGMDKCFLWSDIVLVLGGPTDASGNASIGVPLPNDPSLVGQHLFSQFLVVDIGANALGAVTSPGGLTIMR